jgi:hypothetical protein
MVDATVFKTEAWRQMRVRVPSGVLIPFQELLMATAKETMSTIENQLSDVRREIDRLKIEEATLMRLIRTLGGQTEDDAPRKRIPNVKPLVLQIMQASGANGATSTEVYQTVRQRHSDISRDTVSSVLSRLKSAEALRYDGERYFDTRFVRDRVLDLVASAGSKVRVNG